MGVAHQLLRPEGWWTDGTGTSAAIPRSPASVCGGWLSVRQNPNAMFARCPLAAGAAVHPSSRWYSRSGRDGLWHNSTFWPFSVDENERLPEFTILLRCPRDFPTDESEADVDCKYCMCRRRSIEAFGQLRGDCTKHGRSFFLLRSLTSKLLSVSRVEDVQSRYV